MGGRPTGKGENAMIITIVSFKGGVGKTTTAVHLAAYFNTMGKTVLLDGDVNRSATAWAERGNGKLPIDIVDETLAFSVSQYTHFVIDTAARPSTSILKGLAERVQLIVIPTTCDGLSLDALSKTVEALQEVR